MEQLLELFLSGGIRIPLFDPDLLALDRDLPKSELLALLMLQRRGEAIMSELAADVGVPLSTATGIGERLARRGLIQRERHTKDHRVILIRLTPRGQELAAQIRSHMDDLLARVQKALTPAEVAELVRLVQKVMAALVAVPSPAPESPAGPASARRIPIED